MILEGIRKGSNIRQCFFSLWQCVCISASLRPHLYRAAAVRMLLGIKRPSQTQSAFPHHPSTSSSPFHLLTFLLFISPINYFIPIASAGALTFLLASHFKDIGPQLVSSLKILISVFVNAEIYCNKMKTNLSPFSKVCLCLQQEADIFCEKAAKGAPAQRSRIDR